jgi:GGDEF domain-containing protein
VDSRERSLERLERSHRRYLKLRSVLYDRVTGLPAFPILLDRLRSWLDDRRAIGVLYIEVENLGVVESLYGWQVLDRILARVAGELSEAVGTELPDGSLLGLNGVAGDRFAAFVPRQPDGSEVDTSYLVDLGSRLCARLEEAFAGDDFTGISNGPGSAHARSVLSFRAPRLCRAGASPYARASPSEPPGAGCR